MAFDRNEYMRKYRAEHPDQIKAYRKKEYQRHKEENLAKCKEWHKNNKDKVREYNKKYYAKNKNKINAYRKKKYKEKCIEYLAKYVENIDNAW